MTFVIDKRKCRKCSITPVAGRGRTLCDSCRVTNMRAWAVGKRPRATVSSCLVCGAQRPAGRQLCDVCKESAQKVNRVPAPCSVCGRAKDRGGIGVKLCSECKSTEAIRAAARLDAYRSSGEWKVVGRKCSAARRIRLAGTSILKDRVRDSTLKAKFMISSVDYGRMLVAQGGVCAICKLPETRLDRRTRSKVQRLSVDHDHKTGSVRGLLCAACNAAIGLLKDDPLRMRRAAEYVASASNQHQLTEAV